MSQKRRSSTGREEDRGESQGEPTDVVVDVGVATKQVRRLLADGSRAYLAGDYAKAFRCWGRILSLSARSAYQLSLLVHED